MSGVTSHELAYMAGILDGEGCIAIEKSQRKGKPSPEYNVSVRVKMASEPITNMFLESFGGTVVYIPRSRPDYKDMYRWSLRSRPDIAEVLRMLLPYLIEKKAQAERILDFIEDFEPCSSTRVSDKQAFMREEAYKELQWMKRQTDQMKL